MPIKDPTKRIENQRAWRKAHPDRLKAWVKRYAQKYPEKVNAKSRQWRKENPEKAKLSQKRYKAKYPERYKLSQKRRSLKRYYGMTLEQFNILLETQNKKCKICQSEFNESGFLRAMVDHDHNDGRVRGLLCGKCNSLLGYAKDDVEILLSAIKYLTQ